MGSKAKEVLDKLEKEEKRKLIKGILLGLGLVGLMCLYMFYVYDPYISTNEMFKAKIIGVFKPDSENRVVTIRCTVKLETGETVLVSGARMGAIRMKTPIIVQKIESKYFKKTRYRFLQYVELNNKKIFH